MSTGRIFASKSSTCAGVGTDGLPVCARAGPAADSRSAAVRTNSADAPPIHARGFINCMAARVVTGYYAAAGAQIPMSRWTLVFVAACAALPVFAQTPPVQPPSGRKRPGVTTPVARIPMTKLKPEASYDVPGAPDWMAIEKEVWVSNAPKHTVSRLDPKS